MANRLSEPTMSRIISRIHLLGHDDTISCAKDRQRDEVTSLELAVSRIESALAEKTCLEQQVREATLQQRVLADRLASLSLLAETLSQPLDLEQVLRQSLTQALALLELRAGWILLVADQDGGVPLMVSRGLPGKVSAAQRQCAWIRSAQDRALSLGEPQVLSDPVGPCSYREEQAMLSATAIESATDADPACAVGQFLAERGLAFRACVPLQSRAQILGVMGLVGDRDRGLQHLGEDILELLTAIGRQIGVAVENARLYGELSEKEALRRQLLARVLALQEEERRRIARELHDRMGQSLTSLIVSLGMIDSDGSPEDTATHVQALRDTVGLILDDVHELALKIRPPVLDDLGLLAALRDYLRDFRDRHCLFVDLQVLGLGEERLPAQIETAVYRIVQEALTNIVRHAQAEGVSVLVEKRNGELTLIVEDDGVGFDVDAMLGSGPNVGNLGLYGMRELALLLGGSLTIESGKSRGTSVFVRVPEVSGEDANGKDPYSGC